MNMFGFNSDQSWDYENGFYITSPVTRLAKALAQYELYKSIVDLPGHIVECGVYKGTSLMRFATFREILESQYSRKIIGFDVFGKFPEQKNKIDNEFIKQFERQGGVGIPVDELEKILVYKGITNYELIKGNICDTVPQYVLNHPELKIVLLHIDVDVYEPSRVILDTLYNRVVSGGLILLDDFGTVDGETRALDEFCLKEEFVVKKLPISGTPMFIRKK
jgi:hypothetical protein